MAGIHMSSALQSTAAMPPGKVEYETQYVVNAFQSTKSRYAYLKNVAAGRVKDGCSTVRSIKNSGTSPKNKSNGSGLVGQPSQSKSAPTTASSGNILRLFSAFHNKNKFSFYSFSRKYLYQFLQAAINGFFEHFG